MKNLSTSSLKFEHGQGLPPLYLDRPILTVSTSTPSGAVPTRRDDYRSFRHTEKEQGVVAIHPGDNFPVISIEIAVDHLQAERRAQVLGMDVVGDVEAGCEVLQIRKPVSEVMATVK